MKENQPQTSGFCQHVPSSGTAETATCRPPHQVRVILEKDDLDSKIGRLLVFTKSNTFAKLDPGEMDRLNAQLEAMAAYSRILGERIAHFQS